MPHQTLVQWREWGQDAFREARETDRPILLDIGAVWCHWCHVMDTGIPGHPIHTGTYSDPQVAALIAERFVPVKVDNDRRPDINARYNMGGWPTTAFLTPTGETLYGETYVTPNRMIDLLRSISEYYRDNKSDIALRIAEHDEAKRDEFGPGSISVEIVRTVADAIKSAFDPVYGGFGTEPKFPHAHVLALCIREYALYADAELRAIAEKTIDGMAGGGMYDRYAGGFFRYSTTRDWSVPHYEKMLEDNALLSKICFLAARAFQEPRFAYVGMEVHDWLSTVMGDPKTGAFAGSQDADKEAEYYGRPLAERESLPTPFIDRTVYADWNALAVSSLAERYRYRREEPVRWAAMRTYRFVKENVWPRHYTSEGEEGGEEYLLADVTAMLAAALDMAEIADDSAAYIDDARMFANVIVTRLRDAESGGFLDLAPAPDRLGALAQPRNEISADSAAAAALLRLSVVTGSSAFADHGAAALRLHAEAYRRMSFFAARYAGAVRTALSEPIRIVIVAKPSSADASELRNCVWDNGPIDAVVESRPLESAGEYPADPDGAALAYVCIGTICLAPVKTAEELRAAMRAERGRIEVASS
jgi:hypothetical protein